MEKKRKREGKGKEEKRREEKILNKKEDVKFLNSKG